MLLVIDQGASKTAAALVAKDGSILSVATVGGACYFAAGVELAFQRIQEAAEQAAAAAGRSLGEVEGIYAGLAGANWPDEIEMLTREFRDRFAADRVTVCNDCVVALRGGSDKDNSIILCAGSGCNGAVMVGGKIKEVFNNYISGEDQGGNALGGRALQAVFDSHMGIRRKTVLTERLLTYFGYREVDELLLGRDHRKLRHEPRTAVPILLQAAEENDPVALDVIYEFSQSVARYAASSLRKFGLVGEDCEVVLSGGVFKSDNPLFLDTISAEVHRVSRQARIVNAKYEPIVGAALLALEEAGAGPESIATCRKCAGALGLVRQDRLRDAD